MKRLALALLLATLLWPSWPSPASAAPAPADNPQSSPCVTAAAAALAKRGYSYVWGAKGPNSFDCSGLTYWAWQSAGFDIGVSTYNQANAGKRISCDMADLNGASTSCWQPGDLIFLKYSGGQHVAIYIRDGLFMDCYNPSTGCILHNVKADSFYQQNFWQGRRIVECGESSGPIVGSPDEAGLETPGFETIPKLLGDLYITVPQCGVCNANGYDPLAPSPEPVVSITDPFSSFAWLAWRLGEFLRVLLCFLLSLLQLLANMLQYIVNALIGAINAFWRLIITLWLQVRVAVLGFWLMFGDLYGALLGLGGFSWGFALEELWQLILILLAAIGNLLLLLGQLALIPLKVAAWAGALVLGIFLQIAGAVQSTTVPAALSGSTSPIYYATHGALRGLIESQAAWLVYLAIGMAYVWFIFWAAKTFRSATIGDE